MFLSKKGARALASSMALAFAVTGLTYSPANVQAASNDAPTVKVLGATLRLDGESGEQSLRLGIEVGNASNAEACGINITANGKTVTIGTDVGDTATTKQNKTIYEKNEEENKIVYTAVIKGIPMASYGTDFEVKGYAKQSVAAADKSETDVLARSVNKVVKAMQAVNPNIEIDNSGNLVKVVKDEEGNVTSTTPVTSKDFTQLDTIPEATKEGLVDLSEEGAVVTDENATISYDNSTGILSAKIGIYSGIIIKNPLNSSCYSKYKTVKVTYKEKKDTNLNNLSTYVFDGAMGNGGKGQTPEGQKEYGKLTKTKGGYKVVTLSAENSLYGIKFVNFSDVDAELEIKAIEFIEPEVEAEKPDVVEIDLNNTSVPGWGKTATITKLDNGSVKLDWAADASDYTGVTFSLDKAYDLTGYTCYVDAEGDSMTFTISDATRKEPAFNNPQACYVQYGCPFPKEVKLDDNTLSNQLDKEGYDPDFKNVGAVSIGKGTGKDVKTVTVKSIKFYKNGISKPTVGDDVTP